MEKRFAMPAVAAALLSLAGCLGTSQLRTYTVDFVDDDMEMSVTADFEYGDGSKHKTPYVNAHGDTEWFVSDKRCKVKISDGERFTGYQAPSVAGTLYKSDDGEWLIVSFGISCIVARKLPDEDGYGVYFSGVAVEGEHQKSSRGTRVTRWGSDADSIAAPPRKGPPVTTGPSGR